MMRFTANASPESGTVTPPTCPTPDRRDQRLLDRAHTPPVSATLCASVSMPCAPSNREDTV